LTNSTIVTLAVSGTNIYAGAVDSGVFLSTNNGTSWTAINDGLTDTHIWSLAVSGTNLFAGTAFGGVFLSTNNGANWSAVNNGLTSTSIRFLAVTGTNVFAIAQASLSDSIFLSTNNGASWTAMSSGLPAISFSRLTISDTYLFAGAWGSGVWRRPLSEMITSVERIASNSPMHFTLEQNYPNPFNPTTTIGFRIQVPSLATLKVFDILGHKVATLVNEMLDSGSYSVIWDATDFAGGVYFFQLQAGTFVETKKLVLVK